MGKVVEMGIFCGGRRGGGKWKMENEERSLARYWRWLPFFVSTALQTFAFIAP
jgi:hypothetical protein